RPGAILGQTRPRPGPTADAPQTGGRLLPARRAGENHEVLSHPHDVGQPSGFQAVAKVTGDAVAGVGDGRPAGQPLGPDFVQHLQGDLGLGQHATLTLWDARLVQPLLVGEPALWQVEADVQGVVPSGADVMHADSDLAVGLLTQGAAVLALDADGMATLLGEGDVVEEEDAFGAGEGAGQQGAVTFEDLGMVPGALVDELLQGLVFVLDVQVVGDGDAPGERLDALAFAVEEQALEVDTGPRGGPGLGEVGGEARGVLGQTAEHGRREFRGVGLHTSLYAPAHRPV